MQIQHIEQIQRLIGVNYFQHFYLANAIVQLYENDVAPNRLWVQGNPESWILFLGVSRQFQIYGKNWRDEQLEEFLLQFDEVKGQFEVLGNRLLIETLLSRRDNCSFELKKRRIFYETTATADVDINDLAFIRKAYQNDLDILAEMNREFFFEEYRGKNNKSLTELKEGMSLTINNDCAFVAVIEDNVIGFGTIMDTVFQNRMIGTIYVKPELRAQNIGKYLLKVMSDNVLIDDPVCWLMTDESNIVANKMVSQTGYNSIYNFISGDIIVE